jgi:peptide deformylase
MKKLLAPEKYGVALAAPQVGDPVRVFIIAGSALAKRNKNEDDPIPPDQVYINPVITKMSHAKKDKHEGCLSLPGFWGEVPRAEKVTIEAYDEHGKKFTRGASGFLAHMYQHEVDHLEGILYVDKAVGMYRDGEHKDDDYEEE